MRGMILAILALAAARQDDKAAGELLDAVRKKISEAKTVRVEFSMTVQEGRGSDESFAGKIKVKGKDRWAFSLKESRRGRDRDTVSLMCDGRKVIPAEPTKDHVPTFQPEEWGTELRTSSALTTLSMLLRIYGMKESGESGTAPVVSDVKDGGKEKVGDREARVVEFKIKLTGGKLTGEDVKVKSYIDPELKIPLKREITFDGATVAENFQAFSIDEDLPDSDFAWQSNRRLAQARTRQLARSVELFGVFTGRHPRSLDELTKRPGWLEPEVFWPDGGFVLGGILPKDPWGHPFELRIERGRVSVVCLGADGKVGGKGDDEDVAIAAPPVTRRPVGAPNERLLNHFTARVQIHLLTAAVRAFQESYAELPRKKAALWEKPEWAEVWPAGGWCPGGQVPKDPWGDPYRIISEEGLVRIQLKDPKAHPMSFKLISAEEKRQLEEISRPRYTEDEKKHIAELMDRMSEDDLDAREQAEEELKAMGPAIVPMLQERLKGEKDSEVIGRLTKVVRSSPPRRPGWMSESASLAVTVTGGPYDSGESSSNERSASASLKTIATAEADFRSNDRDANGINDFWCADVRGLYTWSPNGNKIKLIQRDVAAADGAPSPLTPALEGGAEPAPYCGYYFKMIEKDETGNPYADTNGHNTSEFGVCAYPAEYGASGTRTFILSEEFTLYWKDTEGESVTQWPTAEELASEWRKLD